jgi:hypothetical protein
MALYGGIGAWWSVLLLLLWVVVLVLLFLVLCCSFLLFSLAHLELLGLSCPLLWLILLL